MLQVPCTIAAFRDFRDIGQVLIRRLILLYTGLMLYGLSSAMMVRSGLGLDPWNVLHQGIAEHVHLSFGTVIIGVGAGLMLIWIPLRQRPGVGTISNVIFVGLAADAVLALLPQIGVLIVRIAMMIAAVVLNGIASGMYIGAGLGPGPRDGLMTGLAARTGWAIGRTRMGIEICVLGLGWMLGGTVGIGTILYALAIGALIQTVLPAFQSMVANTDRVGS